jgi:hypothetical protein
MPPIRLRLIHIAGTNFRSVSHRPGLSFSTNFSSAASFSAGSTTKTAFPNATTER